MKTALVIVSAILLAFSAFRLSNYNTQTPVEVVNAFQKWSVEHGKQYSTPTEFAYRLSVFYKSYVEVQTHNAKNGVTYTRGLNKFSDLTSEEFLSKYTGYKPSTKPRNNPVHQIRGDAPASADWREHGAVNDVKDQRMCGSCWAFSAVAALEAAWQIHKGTLLSLSEQQLVDCSKKYGNYGCNGGLMDYAFEYIKDQGIALESAYPYRGYNERCKYDGHPAASDLGFTDIAVKDPLALKDAAAQTVVSVAIAADSIQSYRGGVFNDSSCGVRLDHGVAVVGYGAEGDVLYWIVRNSWGGSWGESGYIRMIRTDEPGPGMCGICLAASYPNVADSM